PSRDRDRDRPACTGFHGVPERPPPLPQGDCGVAVTVAVGSARETAVAVVPSYAFAADAAPLGSLGTGGAGTTGLFQVAGGATSPTEFGAPLDPFRREPPNLTFTPAQSVSAWASSRIDEPGIWRIGPSMALRKPWTQASEVVMCSVS